MLPSSPSLPIDDVLPQLCSALARGPNAVLMAPPGAGKTTRVPLALIDQLPDVLPDRIIMLEPRRLAARAAASRMAKSLGEPVGRRIGLRVRGETNVSRETRIEVVTTGVFTRMILDDPELDRISAVLFDEFHERQLDADLGLALALDAQAALRPDLRLLPMSATLDGDRIAALLPGAAIVKSEGRMFPVETVYRGRDPRRRIEDQVTEAIIAAIGRETGSILVFLPGAGEIRRVQGQLEERLQRADVQVWPLHGTLDVRAQDQAIAPSPSGIRKIVLATSIAETSLTIDGVRVVIDAGLSRRPKFNVQSGLSQLETVRVSQAAADQRRGRAGRTEPGVCWRLWDEAETRSLPKFDRPEILEADLSGLMLDLARWGAQPQSLSWLDAPPKAAIDDAHRRLRGLGALDEAGALTSHGALLARLPLAPSLAHLIVVGAAQGQAFLAAKLAVLLSDPSLGGTSRDLAHRLDDLASAPRWAERQALRMAEDWAQLIGPDTKPPPSTAPTARDIAKLMAHAFPDHIGQARPGRPGAFLLASGRGAIVPADDKLATAAFIIAGDLGGGTSESQIRAAIALDPQDFDHWFAHSVNESLETAYDPDAEAVRTRRRTHFRALTLREAPTNETDTKRAQDAWLQAVSERGLDILPCAGAARALQARIAFLRQLFPERWPDIADEALVASAAQWLPEAIGSARRRDQIQSGQIARAWRDQLDWTQQRDLDQLAPATLSTPAGRERDIDYAADGGPLVEVRVQEMFGLTTHPMLAGGLVPLTLALVSPAGRPVQVTKDLPSFWSGSYAAVRADLRGRYPKHPWPENPAAALPTLKVKPRS